MLISKSFEVCYWPIMGQYFLGTFIIEDCSVAPETYLMLILWQSLRETCHCSSRNGCSSTPPRCSLEGEGFSPCQGPHRQTLAPCTSRPTKEEPCLLECSRRWPPPSKARTRKPSCLLAWSSLPSWTLPRMSTRFLWYQTYRNLSV